MDAYKNQYDVLINVGRIITTPAGMFQGGYQYQKRQEAGK